MLKSFEMDQNLYEKCVIYIQVHSGEDVKFYQYKKTYITEPNRNSPNLTIT